MSGGVSFGHKNGGQPVPAGWDEPPFAGDGPDLYIQKLFDRHLDRPRDTFSLNRRYGNYPPPKEKGSILSSITKWAGLAFAGVLGFLGLKKFVWPRLRG